MAKNILLIPASGFELILENGAVRPREAKPDDPHRAEHDVGGDRSDNVAGPEPGHGRPGSSAGPVPDHGTSGASAGPRGIVVDDGFPPLKPVFGFVRKAGANDAVFSSWSRLSSHVLEEVSKDPAARRDMHLQLRSFEPVSEHALTDLRNSLPDGAAVRITIGTTGPTTD